MSSLSSYIASLDPVMLGHVAPDDAKTIEALRKDHQRHLDASKPRASRAVLAPSGLTESEREFWKWTRRRRMTLTRHGWPDFLVERGGKIIGVEVKQDPDQLRPNQRETFEVLERAGIEVFVWRLGVDVLVPWREDDGGYENDAEAPEDEEPYVPEEVKPSEYRTGTSGPRCEELTRRHLDLISMKTLFMHDTIEKWARGADVRKAAARACRRACKALGIELR